MKTGTQSKHRVLWLAALLFATSGALAATSVTQAAWGKDSAGEAVDLYTVTSPQAEVKISTYGARIVSLRVPDRQGKMGNVVLGFDSVEGYLTPRGSAMGATIGRYANRIAGGEFTLNGATYQIPKNSGKNALHGGPAGFDRKVWSARKVKNGVEMTLVSPDGDMGFPGKLSVRVRFTLESRKGKPALNIEYFATTDKATVINLTNHAYFNLADDVATPVMDHKAMIRADGYTPVDDTGIPTGEIRQVEGTPYDFRAVHAIGDNIPARGYDNNFVLRKTGMAQAAAEVEEPKSGRTVQVFTTEPGLQFYVPRFPAPPPSADGTRRPGLAAFCLETQHFPDSPNHPNFPTTTLLPGKPFKSTTIYVFGISALHPGAN